MIKKPNSKTHKEKYEGKYKTNGGRLASKREAERHPSTHEDTIKKSHHHRDELGKKDERKAYEEEFPKFGHVPSTSRDSRDGFQHKRTGNGMKKSSINDDTRRTCHKSENLMSDGRESSKHRRGAAKRDSSNSSETDNESLKSSRKRPESRRRRSKSRSRSLDDSYRRRQTSTNRRYSPRRRPKSVSPPREKVPYYADAQRERDRLREKYGSDGRARRRSSSRERRRRRSRERRSKTPVRETTKIVTVPVPVPVYPSIYPDGSMYDWYDPSWQAGLFSQGVMPPRQIPRPMRTHAPFPTSPFMVDPFHRPMRPGMPPPRPFRPPQGFPPPRFHRPH